MTTLQAMQRVFLSGAIALALGGCSEPAEGIAEPESVSLVGTPVPAPDGSLTPEDLVLRDENWPHRVRLVEPWTPESGETLRPVGVLLQVESPEAARIDFGSQGVHDVPVAVTDLVERANEVRAKGPDSKIGNLTRMIGGALVNPAHETPRTYRRSKVAKRDLLLVAAPPDPALLSGMAAPLARIDEREGLRVVLMVEGEAETSEVLATLHALGWGTPFLRQRFVQAVTEGYLREDRTLPWVALLTPNGRSLYEGPWPSEGERQALESALAERRRKARAPQPEAVAAAGQQP
jgi:hypothetical protein